MPSIIPFRAWLYAKSFSKEYDRLISPPYDVISSEMLEELRNKHSYNSVRLSLTEDTNDPDRYKKMRDRFIDWKSKGILERASTPAVYLIEEKFSVEGKSKTRLGFVALMEVSDFSKREVLPHEKTLSGPKKDRLALLEEMGAELSQIFLCYKDPARTLETLHAAESIKTPTMRVAPTYGVERKMWALTDEAQVSALQALIQNQSVLIADGHHRYETAVAMQKSHPGPKSHYVQGYFTNLDAPDFSILPIHRIFSLPKDFSPESFQKRLAEKFEIHPFDPGLNLEELTQRKSSQRIQFLMQMSGDSKVWLVSRKKENADDAEIFALQKDIFESLFQWNIAEISYDTLKYEHETEAFQKTLAKMPRGVGLFLPPTDLDLVMKLALRGERMPQKSTFFFPKIATGLINYELGSI
jgi:uncharacterized protein (DUF1015 family)